MNASHSHPHFLKSTSKQWRQKESFLQIEQPELQLLARFQQSRFLLLQKQRGWRRLRLGNSRIVGKPPPHLPQIFRYYNARLWERGEFRWLVVCLCLYVSLCFSLLKIEVISCALMESREYPKVLQFESSSGLALRNTIYRPDFCSNSLAKEFALGPPARLNKLLPWGK